MNTVFDTPDEAEPPHFKPLLQGNIFDHLLRRHIYRNGWSKSSETKVCWTTYSQVKHLMLFYNTLSKAYQHQSPSELLVRGVKRRNFTTYPAAKQQNAGRAVVHLHRTNDGAAVILVAVIDDISLSHIESQGATVLLRSRSGSLRDHNC